MKYVTLAILLAAVITVTAYKTGSELGAFDLMHSSFASALLSKPALNGMPDCQSSIQATKIQKLINSNIKNIEAIPSQIASSTKMLAINELALKKASDAEASARKTFESDTSAYNKLLASKTKKTSLLMAAKEKLRKSESVYIKARDAKNKVQAATLENKNYLNRLKNGTQKTNLETTILNFKKELEELKKKSPCPSVESKGGQDDSMCTDLIDNDMNGLVDCEDSSCNANNACAIKNPTKEEILNLNMKSYVIKPDGPDGTCSNSNYRDQASCEGAMRIVDGGCNDLVSETEPICLGKGGEWTPSTEENAGYIWTVIEKPQVTTKTCSNGTVVPTEQPCIGDNSYGKLSSCHIEVCTLQNYICRQSSSKTDCDNKFMFCEDQDITKSQCEATLMYTKKILKSRGLKISGGN